MLLGLQMFYEHPPFPGSAALKRSDDTECKFGVVIPDIACFEDDGGKVRMMHGVGEVLRFQAEACKAGGNAAGFVGLMADGIAGVELHTGHIRGQGQADAGVGRVSLYAVLLGRQHVIVIVALADEQLRMIPADIGADGLGLAEIKGRAGDGGVLAGGNERFTGKRIGVGGDLEDVIADITFAVEVKVGVVCQVDNRIGVAAGLVVDAEPAVVGERIGNLHVEIAGEAFLAVGGMEGENEGVILNSVLPDAVGVADNAAVDGVGRAVGGELIELAVQLKACIGDAVCHTADQGAEVGAVVVILSHGVKTQHNIGQLSGFVRYADALDDAAAVENAHIGTFGVFKAKGQYVKIIPVFSEIFTAN